MSEKMYWRIQVMLQNHDFWNPTSLYFLTQIFQHTRYQFQDLLVVVAQEKGLILTLTLQLCNFTNFTRICYWLVVISDRSYFQI